MAKGEADAAVAAFRAVLDQDPGNVTARHNLGSALMQKGDVEGAIALYRELTAAHPENAEAFYNLGVALKQKDDFAGAEAALRRAIALDPQSQLPEAPYTLGVTLWQIGRAEDAATAFRAALAARTDYAEAHYMLGTVLRQQGGRRRRPGRAARDGAPAAALRRGAAQHRPDPAPGGRRRGRDGGVRGSRAASQADGRRSGRFLRRQRGNRGSSRPAIWPARSRAFGRRCSSPRAGRGALSARPGPTELRAGRGRGSRQHLAEAPGVSRRTCRAA